MSYYDRDKSPNNGGTTLAVGGNLNWPKPHLGHTPEYQVSGFPFAYTIANEDVDDLDEDGAVGDTVPSGAIIKVSFPQITRWLLISAHKTNDKADHGTCHIAFHEDGFDEGTYVDTRFFDTQRLELKCAAVWIRFTDSAKIDHVEIIAGLTGIEAAAFGNLQTLDNLGSGGQNIYGLNVKPTTEWSYTAP